MNQQQRRGCFRGEPPGNLTKPQSNTSPRYPWDSCAPAALPGLCEFSVVKWFTLSDGVCVAATSNLHRTADEKPRLFFREIIYLIWNEIYFAKKSIWTSRCSQECWTVDGHCWHLGWAGLPGALVRSLLWWHCSRQGGHHGIWAALGFSMGRCTCWSQPSFAVCWSMVCSNLWNMRLASYKYCAGTAMNQPVKRNCMRVPFKTRGIHLKNTYWTWPRSPAHVRYSWIRPIKPELLKSGLKDTVSKHWSMIKVWHWEGTTEGSGTLLIPPVGRSVFLAFGVWLSMGRTPRMATKIPHVIFYLEWIKEWD